MLSPEIESFLLFLIFVGVCILGAWAIREGK
jgi:hypothetical protein